MTEKSLPKTEKNCRKILSCQNKVLPLHRETKKTVINQLKIITMNAPKNISGLSAETTKNRINSMINLLQIAKENVTNLHVSISEGNNKTGKLVPSVSLLPLIDCNNCKHCCKMCYDFRNDCVYKKVQNSRAKNSAIWAIEPDRYFQEINDYLAKNFVSFFRYHIGGDIKDSNYFAHMIETANSNPKVNFLAFTKCFDIVNDWIDKNGNLPANMQIIFSGWRDQKMNNKYNLPTSHPRFADGYTTAPDHAKECTGNCSECAFTNSGCWTLRAGEAVIFNAH